mmetsp:Transcript_32323/g.72949  ORF Transcript_32323/g.72949 Transcript_32323/m.72949 type:complete len:336 (-) Transcript_32323:103-1110(-)
MVGVQARRRKVPFTHIKAFRPDTQYPAIREGVLCRWLVLRRRGRFVYAANALTDVASQILSAQLIQRRGGLHPIVAHGAQWHQRFAQLVELFLQDQGDTAAGKARAPMRSKYGSTVHDRSARGLMAADVNHEGGDSADGDGSEFWTLGDAQRWDTQFLEAYLCRAVAGAEAHWLTKHERVFLLSAIESRRRSVAWGEAGWDKASWGRASSHDQAQTTKWDTIPNEYLGYGTESPYRVPTKVRHEGLALLATNGAEPLYLEFAFYGEPLRPEAVEVGRALHGAVRLIPCDHGRREAAGRLVVTRKSRLRCHTATIDDECPKGGARRDEGGRHPAFS